MKIGPVFEAVSRHEEVLQELLLTAFRNELPISNVVALRNPIAVPTEDGVLSLDHFQVSPFALGPGVYPEERRIFQNRGERLPVAPEIIIRLTAGMPLENVACTGLAVHLGYKHFTIYPGLFPDDDTPQLPEALIRNRLHPESFRVSGVHNTTPEHGSEINWGPRGRIAGNRDGGWDADLAALVIHAIAAQRDELRF